MNHPKQDTAPIAPSTSQHRSKTRKSAPSIQRLRYTPTAFVPLIIGALCALPFAAAVGYWGLLLAIPFIVAVLAQRRVGLDVTEDAVVVRGILGAVTIDKSDLTGFKVTGNDVHLVRADTSTVRIPTVRPRDLPTLRALIFETNSVRSSKSNTPPHLPH